VLPHLAETDHEPAVARLRTLLAPGGTLYLSWRVCPATTRDDDRRLYSAIRGDQVLTALSDTETLHDETVAGAWSGAPVRSIVVRAPQT
jgi:hypothetical protein